MRVQYLRAYLFDDRIIRLQRDGSVGPFDGGEAALLARTLPLHPGKAELCTGPPGDSRIGERDQLQQKGHPLFTLTHIAMQALQYAQLQSCTAIELLVARQSSSMRLTDSIARRSSSPSPSRMRWQARSYLAIWLPDCAAHSNQCAADAASR